MYIEESIINHRSCECNIESMRDYYLNIIKEMKKSPGKIQRVEKKPHVCPNCSGDGKRIVDMHFRTCQSCDGSGILWG